MATVLGVHYSHHGSACIVRDGRLIAALSSERLSRQKASHGVTDELLDYLFTWTDIGIEDIDCIALSDWHHQFAFHPMKVKQDGNDVDCLWNRIYDNTCLHLDISLRDKSFQGFHIGHQLNHAAAAFYTSPYDEAYCFTMDASGANHKNNSLVAYGKGKELSSL